MTEIRRHRSRGPFACQDSFRNEDLLFRELGKTLGPTNRAWPIDNSGRPKNSKYPVAKETLVFHGTFDDDNVLCECWCGRTRVRITYRDLINGRTDVCGWAKCTPGCTYVGTRTGNFHTAPLPSSKELKEQAS